MVDDRTRTSAQRLQELHCTGAPLVLPTVWDGWSARVAVRAGFRALTIGSHPLADARGAEDGEGQTLDEVLTAVARITTAVDVPVSVDLESGYGADPQTLVDGLLAAGGVGLNLEDTVHREGGRLRTLEEHAALIGAVRAAADAAGVPVVINGRTDIFLRHDGQPTEVLPKGITRLQALIDAGADVVYPVGVRDDETIATLVSALPRPVNVIASPDRDDLARFTSLGVGRITFGPYFQRALGVEAERMLQGWD